MNTSIIGKNTVVAPSADLYNCTVGDNCRISGFVFIEEDVHIGSFCKIRPFTFIPTGVTIEDGVFIGPHVTFINDRYPLAMNNDGKLQQDSDWILEKTLVKKGASIGAGAVILCGVTIGEYALVGCGAVVTKDVPTRTIVVGNPAKAIRRLKHGD